MEVTASGLPRQRRQELQALVERLRGVWSGALTVGRTAAVVVDAAGPAAVDWQAPKLAVARQHGIAVVSSEWLEDSAQHGFLLATRAYQLSPPAPGRRSSAASTSLAGAAPPANPATTTATARPAEEQLAPLLAPPLLQLRQPHEQHMIQQQRRQADGSPEVERLREARSPLAPLQAPAFLERSPAAASPAAPSSVGPHATVHDKLVEPLPSPAMAPDVRSSGGQRLAGLLPSPSPLPALGDEAQLLPASQAGSCGPAALLPSPADSSLSSGPAARAAGGRAAGTPTSRRDDAVTPVGAAALEGGALRSPSTDSDIVARFLSRRPCITVARGSALPRRHLAASPSPSPSPSPSSNAGTSIRSSMSSGGSSSGGGALSAAHSPAAAVADSPADDGSRWGQGGGTPQPDGATERAAGAAATRAGEAQGQGIAGGLAPTPAPIPAHWLSDSVARMPRGLAEGGLPATTLVRMGPRLQRAPGRSTLQGLAERHGGGEGGSDPPAASFYASATALPEGGAELQFVAGECFPALGAVPLLRSRPPGPRCRIACTPRAAAVPRRLPQPLPAICSPLTPRCRRRQPRRGDAVRPWRGRAPGVCPCAHPDHLPAGGPRPAGQRR